MSTLTKNNVVLFCSSLCIFTFATGFVTREVPFHHKTLTSSFGPRVRDGRDSSLLAEKRRKKESPRNKRKIFTKVSSSDTEDIRNIQDEKVGGAATDQVELQNESQIVRILRKYGLDSKIEELDTASLPVIGEVFVKGEWNLCLVKGLKPPSSVTTISKASEIKPPRVEILLIRENHDGGPIDYKDENILKEYLHVVDMGQIISIWSQYNLNSFKGFNECAKYLSSQLSLASDKVRFGLPVNRAEVSMKGLYESRVNVKQGGKKNLTKKTINQICSALPSPEYSNHVGQIMHTVRKAGRLVTYADAGASVLGSKQVDTDIMQSLVGAMILAQDASLGGRFKRSSCIFVSADYETTEKALNVKSIALIIGGWLVVDKAIRATAEAKKFVERNLKPDDNPTDKVHKIGQQRDILTSADQQLLYELECIAMGKTVDSEENRIALGARQILVSMNLPLSQEGAQEALVRVGKWSEKGDRLSQGRKKSVLFEPWSVEVLNSARELVKHEETRKDQFEQYLTNNPPKKDQDCILEGRLNISSLPSICIDAKRASFRDDAIGVRPRASTGRKVVRDASKWEILIHITDVSDLFSPDAMTNISSFDPAELQRAAASRGASRYDLPLGPLHLMPPLALDALALNVKKNATDKTKMNRCVTLWAYIDERNGKLIDAGLERTIISSPVALTFKTATSLLEGSHNDLSPLLKASKSILTIAERNLSLWSQQRMKTNTSAKKREERLNVKEMVAKEMNQGSPMRDDGSDGSFQRTRGHRLVDSSLNLYGNTLNQLLSRAKAPIPQASGSNVSRGGRLGTAPLRRYIDGIAQRQALSVICSYGGKPMTRKECIDATKIADDAMIKTNQLRSDKQSGRTKGDLQKLASHLAVNFRADEERVLPALGTGRENEVVISGTGVLTKCSGVTGSLGPGARLMVKITKKEISSSASKCSSRIIHLGNDLKGQKRE